MDPNKTQPAWASRTNLLIIAGVVANLVQRHYGLTLPVEVQGLAVDLLPVAISAIFAAAIWFRVKARAVIDRWF